MTSLAGTLPQYPLYNAGQIWNTLSSVQESPTSQTEYPDEPSTSPFPLIKSVCSSPPSSKPDVRFPIPFVPTSPLQVSPAMMTSRDPEEDDIAGHVNTTQADLSSLTTIKDVFIGEGRKVELGSHIIAWYCMEVF